MFNFCFHSLGISSCSAPSYLKHPLHFLTPHLMAKCLPHLTLEHHSFWYTSINKYSYDVNKIMDINNSMESMFLQICSFLSNLFQSCLYSVFGKIYSFCTGNLVVIHIFIFYLTEVGLEPIARLTYLTTWCCNNRASQPYTCTCSWQSPNCICCGTTRMSCSRELLP